MRAEAWTAGAAVLMLLGAIGYRLHADQVRDRLLSTPPEAILGDPELRKTALTLGRQGFAANCAACHGETGKAVAGDGLPDLTDADHLYGTGDVAGIEQIILHGIRSGDSKGQALASMPVYASARPYSAEPIPPLSPRDVGDVTQFLLAFTGRASDVDSARRGATIFSTRGGCYDCHGSDGHGDSSIGAPNLTDDVWLYGDGSAGAISRSIEGGRAGRMPAFVHRLAPEEARAIAVYTASLGRTPRNEAR